jgi:hypothetical protein
MSLLRLQIGNALGSLLQFEPPRRGCALLRCASVSKSWCGMVMASVRSGAARSFTARPGPSRPGPVFGSSRAGVPSRAVPPRCGRWLRMGVRRAGGAWQPHWQPPSPLWPAYLRIGMRRTRAGSRPWQGPGRSSCRVARRSFTRGAERGSATLPPLPWSVLQPTAAAAVRSAAPTSLLRKARRTARFPRRLGSPLAAPRHGADPRRAPPRAPGPGPPRLPIPTRIAAAAQCEGRAAGRPGGSSAAAGPAGRLVRPGRPVLSRSESRSLSRSESRSLLGREASPAPAVAIGVAAAPGPGPRGLRRPRPSGPPAGSTARSRASRTPPREGGRGQQRGRV